MSNSSKVKVTHKLSEATPVKTELLYKLLELSEALLHGNYSNRIVTDFDDDIATKIADNLNQFSDKVQLNSIGDDYNQDQAVNTFIEVISSFANLDFKKKLPISENGTIMDAIATGINILGEELEQSAASKQELEIERNRLKEAKEYAEEANKAKSSFLANMSHEIRTPLNGILGLTEIMLGEDVQETHRKYLEIIRDSGKNLGQLINDILDFSKIESGKFQLENINFNFNEVIVSSITPHKFIASKKGLNLTYSIDPSVPKEVIGDPTRITQIMTNLIGNAIKFTEEGNIAISFSLIQSKNDEAVIQGIVKDTGIGIPQEKTMAIFQSFTQADGAVARKYGGTGLGLSIVKSLVQQMDGDITVQSPADTTLNRGSAFIFSLKLKTPAKRTHVTPQPSANGQLQTFKKPLKVLIVDDNKVNLLVAKMMVGKFGAAVTTVESGMDAINMVKTHDYDMVLMDIQMPGLDGYQTTMELRKLNYTKPIVALSANAYSEDVQNSLNSGMNDHMQKPFTEKQLYQVMSKFVA